MRVEEFVFVLSSRNERTCCLLFNHRLSAHTNRHTQVIGCSAGGVTMTQPVDVDGSNDEMDR